jgi:hypothetical protein
LVSNGVTAPERERRERERERESEGSIHGVDIVHNNNNYLE